MSKARIIDQDAAFYNEMQPQPKQTGTLKVGEVLELGKIKRRYGKAWVKVTRVSGKQGYMLGDTHIFTMRRVELDQPTDLLDAASPEARVIHQFKKKTRMMMLDVVRQDESGWVQVQDFAGHKGYIPGKTRIRVLPDDLVAAGRKTMAVGSACTTIGLLIAIITYLNASSPVSPYSINILIAWALVILGMLQVAQGMMQFYNGRKDEKGAQKP